MALLDILNDSQIKERGGRHGGKGHEFQRYWALCHLLQVDVEREDYVLLMEFIEDVAVLNGEKIPDQMELFQVKKKEGNSNKWTKNALAKPPKEGRSILAKLHESRLIAKNNIAVIAFVSNAPIELKLTSGDDPKVLSEFFGNQLDVSLIAELRRSVATELSCEEESIDLGNVKFIRTSLAIDDLENHAIGRVATFLAAKFPDQAARADVLCKAIYSEIKVKSTSTEGAATFAELKRIRGISKSQFSAMLSLTLSRKSDHDIIEVFLADLLRENVSYIQRKAIKLAARQFIVEKAGKGQSLLSLLRAQVESLLDTLPEQLITSWEVANWIADQISCSNAANNFSVFSRDYMIAAILYWMNNEERS